MTSQLGFQPSFRITNRATAALTRGERVIKADVISMKNRVNARQRALVIYLLDSPANG